MALILPPFTVLAIGVVVVVRWLSLSRADLFENRTLARENNIALGGVSLVVGGGLWLALMT